MTDRNNFNRIPAKLIEIDQPRCALVYSNAPCTAALGVTGSTFCFNTLATCQDPENYDGSDTLTLRFAESGNMDIPPELNAIPSLRDVSQRPAQLSVGGTNENISPLGSRAVLTARFMDHPYSDLQTDPYLFFRSYNALEQGSFWPRWKARNKYRRGMPVRMVSGYIVGGQLQAHQTYNYLLEKVDGPDSNGNVTLQAYDVLQSLKADRAVYPPLSNGRLSADIDEAATSFTLTPSGIGAEYPASFRCRIGGEGFDVTRSGDVCTVVARGLYGGLEDHKAADTVQEVAQMSGTVQQLAYDIITDVLPELTSYIDKPAWDAIALEFLPRIYSADITEPTGVEDLLAELAQAAPVYWYADIRTNQIVMDAIRPPAQVGVSISEDGHIIAGSLRVTESPKERIDEVWVYYRIRDAAGDIDDENNYSQRFILINPEEQARRGGRSIRRVFTRWIASGARDTAQEIAQQLIARFQETPVRISFDLDAKDAEIWLGNVVQPTIRQLQCADGTPCEINYQVIEAQEAENGDTYRYLAQSYEFFGAVDPDKITISIEPQDTVDGFGVVQQLNLKTLYDNVVISEIPDITFRILGGPGQDGGTIVGSQPAQAYSLVLPNDWSWSPDIRIVIEPGGAVVGQGGAGGIGAPGASAVDGEDGGDAMLIEYPVELDNRGIIGGGGGGGQGNRFIIPLFPSGSITYYYGGGGGAGRAIAPGGFISTQFPEANGGDGTILEGGAGGSFVVQGTEGPGLKLGGDGGGLGEPGLPLSPFYTDSLPGAAGRAIVGDANITYITVGDIRGAVV